MQPPRTPFSKVDLDLFVQHFTYLGEFEEGDRPYVNITEDPKTKKPVYDLSKYNKTSNGSRAWQGMTRSIWGVHSKESIENISKLFKDAHACVEEMCYSTDSQTTLSLFKLSKSISAFKQKGLENILETYTRAISNLKPRTPEETQKRIDDAKKVRDACNQLSEHIQGRVKLLETSMEKESEELTHHFLKLMFSAENYDINYVVHKRLPQLTSSAVYKVLSQTFNDELMDTVFSYYGIDKNNGFIELHLVKSLIVSAVANLRLVDIAKLRAKEDHPLFGNTLQNYAANVDDWTDQELCECLEKLRKVNTSWIQAENNQHPQLLKDFVFLESCSRVADYKPINNPHDPLLHLRHFGFAEYDARTIAYSLCFENARFNNGVLYPSYENKKLKCRAAYSIIAEPGLYALSILPATRFEENPFLRVLFRGSFDKESWNRNLNPIQRRTFNSIPEGPGRGSYELHEVTMNNRIDSAFARLVNRFPDKMKPICIHFIGHSLGATDAQRCMKTITKLLMDKNVEEHADGREHPQQLQRVKSLDLYAFNMPGIEEDIASDFVKMVHKLPHIKFDLRLFKSDGDMVAKFGRVFLGWIPTTMLSPANLNLSIFKFAWRSELSSSSYLANARTNSVTAVTKEAAGRFEAHTHAVLCHNAQFSPYCEYAITSNPADKELKVGETKEKKAEARELRAFGVEMEANIIRSVRAATNKAADVIDSVPAT